MIVNRDRFNELNELEQEFMDKLENSEQAYVEVRIKLKCQLIEIFLFKKQ